MSTPTALHMPVAVAARLIGVSRARVYQRISGKAGTWTAGAPLAATIGKSGSKGARNGRQLRVSLSDALAWRAEREGKGHPVGAWDHAAGPSPAAPPAAVPAQSVGLPSMRPF